MTAASVRFLGLALALCVLGLLVWRSAFLIDDAYISFRYARNWAEHGVPAFHPDASPPVEGYSNFLWVLLLRLCHGLGWGLEGASQTLGVLCGMATLVVLHLHLTRTLALPPVAAALGTLSLAAFPPFAVWCTGGLETGLFSLLCLSTYAALVRRGGSPIPTGLLAGALALGVALTRVEGFAWVLGITAVAWLAGPRQERGRRLAPFFAVYLTGFGLFLFWRHGVYGEWMANTVHAKAGLTGARLLRGAKTTLSFLLLFPSAMAALFLGVLALRGEHRRAALGLGGLFTAFLAYDWLVGGDWMPFFRFLAPGAPMMAALLAIGFARLSSKAATGAAAGLGLLSLLPLFDLHVIPRGMREAMEFREFKQSGYLTEWGRWQKSVSNLESIFLPLGRALAQVATEDDALTFGAIGAVGWESNMRIHDYNGLIDRDVARRSGTATGRSAGHDKAVPRAWFLEREPTMFHATLVSTNSTEDTPIIRNRVLTAATKKINARVFSNPAEEPLRAVTRVQVYPLEPEEGLPPGTWLGVLTAR